MGKGEGKVLVKEVSQKDGHAMVGPATVDQQEPLQVPVNNKGRIQLAIVNADTELHYTYKHAHTH